MKSTTCIDRPVHRRERCRRRSCHRSVGRCGMTWGSQGCRCIVLCVSDRSPLRRRRRADSAPIGLSFQGREPVGGKRPLWFFDHSRKNHVDMRRVDLEGCSAIGDVAVATRSRIHPRRPDIRCADRQRLQLIRRADRHLGTSARRAGLELIRWPPLPSQPIRSISRTSKSFI